MLCPIDGTELKMADRSGVEIDYCPKCRGVWLDRGELDKIIERSAGPAQAAEAPPPRSRDHDAGRFDSDRYDGGRKRKRGGFLDELFDF